MQHILLWFGFSDKLLGAVKFAETSTNLISTTPKAYLCN